MRFYADGPNIPSELLDARDNGEVVFFCGAGISMPAGLPSFASLAKDVIAELGVPDHASSRRLLQRALAESDPDFAPPMDQVFGLLQREYGVALVEQSVSRSLRTPPKADRSYHEIVLRLSTDVSGNARLVTTNFDLLFDTRKSRTKRHVPPALPDLSQEQPLKGIVYLHGRLKGRQSATDNIQGLILGTADFGRAYLADGWATRFVQELLARYTVVLLGYSADDPPIRYLLEGLHSKPAIRSQQIFAFGEGHPDEVDARWRDRGVTAIPYSKADTQHSALWNTLRAWADRADDPIAWRGSVVDLARRGPRKASPHERGQVAALISSPIGAKVFADAGPPPPAEWLCVFDSAFRYAKPGANWPDVGKELFDPLEVYGLDYDPPRQPEGGNQRGPAGIDLLSSLSAEESGSSHLRLAGPFADRSDRLPPRLHHLARWILNVVDQPIAVWWASGKGAFHYRLQELIEWTLNRDTNIITPVIHQAWRLIIEAFKHAPDLNSRDWHDLQPRLKHEGWTRANLREFARIVRPHLKVSRPLLSPLHPPEQSEESLDLRGLVNFEVEVFGRPDDKLSISTEALPTVVASVRRGLEHAISLLGDMQETWWRTPTLHSEDTPGDRYLSEADAYFLWFAKLFNQLCENNSKQAQRELSAWPINEPYFFDKLRIWAWMKHEIVSPVEAADGLLSLSPEAFWNSYLQRELLWTLRARWRDFAPKDRRAVEHRIIQGPKKWSQESDDDYAKRSGHDAAVRLGWLQLNGCDLSAIALHELPRLRAADPGWRESWDQHAEDSLEGRSGWVRTETDPTSIIDAPVSEIIERARQQSKRTPGEFVEYNPFRGIVESAPARALAALSCEARDKRFPVEFWSTALSHWPESASPRASRIFANRLAKLPKPVLVELRYYAPRWLSTYRSQLGPEDAHAIWMIWDAMFEALAEAGSAATTSSIGDMSVEGKRQKRSRRTNEHAINSPIGTLTQCLVDILSDSKPSALSGIPVPIKARMEVAMNAPGEGGDHAVLMLCRQLNWLYGLDPKWSSERLVVLFDLEHVRAEPAWSGLLTDNRLPMPALFRLIKSAFLGAFSRSLDWHWEDRASRRLSQFLVVATLSGKKNDSHLSFDEARVALQTTDDEARHDALWQLQTMVADGDGWKKVGRPFLKKAWPKETRYQTAATSRLLMDIAASAGDGFPDAVQSILPFLRPADGLDMFIHSIERTAEVRGEPIAMRFPREVILLLDRSIADGPKGLPHGLGEVLEMTAKADPALRQDLRWRRLNELFLHG
jgi:hypothetical protein